MVAERCLTRVRVCSLTLRVAVAILRAPHSVIPAKAGIHFALMLRSKSKIKMDPGFRRDDGDRAPNL